VIELAEVAAGRRGWVTREPAGPTRNRFQWLWHAAERARGQPRAGRFCVLSLAL